MSQQSRSSQNQQQQEAQQQYQPTGAGTYPVLPVPALLTDLQQCECPATLEDLTHPTPARVQNIYEWWMNNSLGLNAEDVRRAAEAQLVQMENPVSSLTAPRRVAPMLETLIRASIKGHLSRSHVHGRV